VIDKGLHRSCAEGFELASSSGQTELGFLVEEGYFSLSLFFQNFSQIGLSILASIDFTQNFNVA